VGLIGTPNWDEVEVALLIDAGYERISEFDEVGM
jgi:hypothetical protein